MPEMIGIAIIREIGPVLTALICAGKIGSGIGAELGSMKVTEQIDAMEVSGTNPFKYLVVTRMWACTMMLPLLIIAADAIGMLGTFLMETTKGDVSYTILQQSIQGFSSWRHSTSYLKSFFFGFGNRFSRVLQRLLFRQRNRRCGS